MTRCSLLMSSLSYRSSSNAFLCSLDFRNRVLWTRSFIVIPSLPASRISVSTLLLSLSYSLSDKFSPIATQAFLTMALVNAHPYSASSAVMSVKRDPARMSANFFAVSAALTHIDEVSDPRSDSLSVSFWNLRN
jgi:hypothetical protein